jgi:hypothetical protein
MRGSRARNAYAPKLEEWYASDEAAINPAEYWADFQDKNATTLYQGFMTAAKKAGIQDLILVIKREDSVFLIHKERAGIVLNSETQETSSPDDNNNNGTPE